MAPVVQDRLEVRQRAQWRRQVGGWLGRHRGRALVIAQVADKVGRQRLEPGGAHELHQVARRTTDQQDARPAETAAGPAAQAPPDLHPGQPHEKKCGQQEKSDQGPVDDRLGQEEQHRQGQQADQMESQQIGQQMRRAPAALEAPMLPEEHDQQQPERQRQVGQDRVVAKLGRLLEEGQDVAQQGVQRVGGEHRQEDRHRVRDQDDLAQQPLAGHLHRQLEATSCGSSTGRI